MSWRRARQVGSEARGKYLRQRLEAFSFRLVKRASLPAAFEALAAGRSLSFLKSPVVPRRSLRTTAYSVCEATDRTARMRLAEGPFAEGQERADNAPTAVASGRTEVRSIAAFRCERAVRFALLGGGYRQGVSKLAQGYDPRKNLFLTGNVD
jgi:hypothetical protein